MKTILVAILGCVAISSASYVTYPAASPNPYCKNHGDYLLHPTDRCKYLRCEYLPVGGAGQFFQGRGYVNAKSNSYINAKAYGHANTYRHGPVYGQSAGYGYGHGGNYGHAGNYAQASSYNTGYGYANGNRGYGYQGAYGGYGKLYAVERSCAPGTSVSASSYPNQAKADYTRYGCPFRINTEKANSVCTEVNTAENKCPVKSPYDFKGY